MSGKTKWSLPDAENTFRSRRAGRRPRRLQTIPSSPGEEAAASARRFLAAPGGAAAAATIRRLPPPPPRSRQPLLRRPRETRRPHGAGDSGARVVSPAPPPPCPREGDGGRAGAGTHTLSRCPEEKRLIRSRGSGERGGEPPRLAANSVFIYHQCQKLQKIGTI
ncbi:Hypothetical predicted protein [Podarcis lilfordi]|uniref:Uncharacterized protein n=1 Tax=Podarcis lilfordi TaxID=74358 RepID=A0AA35L3K6_9SAUR|nr:Hypothetical predicted protein [Podarcis lilfordi]